MSQRKKKVGGGPTPGNLLRICQWTVLRRLQIQYRVTHPYYLTHVHVDNLVQRVKACLFI